jgi:YD repeat-containing protein
VQNQIVSAQASTSRDFVSHIAGNWRPIVFFMLLSWCLFTAPLAKASGPVFSQPNFTPPDAGAAQINVTYGNSPLVPAVATITWLGGAPPYTGQWEIVALDLSAQNLSCPTPFVPMPSWISFTPVSAEGINSPLQFQMTIDPTKGGGTVLLAFMRSDDSTQCHPGATITGFNGDWFWSAGGVQFGGFNTATGTPLWSFGTFYVTTDTSSSNQTGTGLDLGPSVPRSGCEGTCGSPINLTNGNVWVEQLDYSLPGLGGGISLARAWNSEWLNNSPFIQAGMFGESWQSSYEKRIQVLGSGTQLRYWRGDGSAWLFNINKTTYTLVSPPDERATLTFSKNTGYTMTLRDGSQELYNTNGYLTALLDRNGNRATLTYDGSNRVTKVTDAASRVLQFNYDPVFIQQVKSIQDATGTIATYSYDSNSRLLSVTYADNSVLNYGYDTNGLLLSVTDQLGKVLESHTYDSERRGLSSQRANGVDLLTISYSWGGSFATLTDSLGNSTIYFSGDQIGNRKYLSNIQGTGCDSCVGRGSQTFAYDGVGNRTSSTDTNGNTTTLTFDSNGNITKALFQLWNSELELHVEQLWRGLDSDRSTRKDHDEYVRR